MRIGARLAMAAALLSTLACNRPAPSPPAADAAASKPASDAVYVCPMDRDVRAEKPGTCPRCGMTLVASIPEPSEYRLELAVTPDPPALREPAELTFTIFDPWKGHRVDRFSLVHEKLFHAFVVSRDLEFFAHEHPVWKDGAFHLPIRLPKSGMYRIASDFYPEAATPQLLTGTVFVPGDDAAPRPLARDVSAKSDANLNVSLSLSPETPVAGGTTQMRFVLTPSDGLERYLGAWGHMLLVSDDLIDMMHTHPALADGSPELQFTAVFPRARAYRIWVQFQRSGVVNTVHFDIPVTRRSADTR
jgi:hypothetical protein